ncbi:MAG: hypothetical protein M1827_002554 [Pycnora praestabilis]|nr:MAG: hypothetical protein M1827_002554 [Pycnora praestabilis]
MSASAANPSGQQQQSRQQERLTPLEEEVLAEYARLAGNMELLANKLNELSGTIPQSSSSTTTSDPPPPTSSITTTGGPHPSIKPSTSTNSTLAETMDGLRALERKTSLVFTLLKASVYSIVLQQQIWSGQEEAEGEGG